MTAIPAEIRLRRVRVPVRIGVGEGERAEPRTLAIDLALVVDLPIDAEGRIEDRLGTTVDYGALQGLIVELAERSEYRLLETFAVELRRAVAAAFPRVREIKVRCTKPRPPLPGEVAAAEVVVPAAASEAP